MRLTWIVASAAALSICQGHPKVDLQGFSSAGLANPDCA